MLKLLMNINRPPYPKIRTKRYEKLGISEQVEGA